MFERFTDRAREVVRRAREEARAEGQRPVGTEHLLLAVLADGDGSATRVSPRTTCASGSPPHRDRGQWPG